MTDPLVTALFSKSQAAVLGLLYAHPDEAFYLRRIVQLTGLGVGHVQREVDRLARAGVLERTAHDRHVYFQANRRCPIYEELRAIVLRTVGAAHVLRQALLSLQGKIRVAFIYGSVARGEENQASDLDLLVIGDVSFAEIVAAVKGSERQLLRPINPMVYPVVEFRDKLAAGHHFLTSVIRDEKVFLLGDEHELRRVSEERVDQAAPHVGRRNRPAAGDRGARHRAKQGGRA
jgi:uncharacterized protein